MPLDLNAAELRFYEEELLASSVDRFGSEGVFDTASGYVSAGIDLNLVRRGWNLTKAQTFTERRVALTYLHEMTHLLQACSTVYGVRKFLDSTIAKFNLLRAIAEATDEGVELKAPLQRWAYSSSCPPKLAEEIKEWQFVWFQQQLAEGGIGRKMVSNFAGDPILRKPVLMRTSSIGFVFSPEPLVVIPKRKVVVPLTETTPPFRPMLLLGGKAIRESWALLMAEVEDSFWAAMSKEEGYEFQEHLDRMRYRSEKDDRFRLYTAATDLVQGVLDLDSPYLHRCGMIWLFDFVLTHATSRIKPGIEEPLLPDNLLLRCLRECVALGISLQDDLEAIHENRFLAVELERLSGALNLPPISEAIRTFVATELDPVLEDFADLPALETERDLLQLCREALELRLKLPNAYINGLNMDCRDAVNDFFERAYRKGFFLLGQEGTGLGDRNSLQRLISENFVRQMMWTNQPMCPMVRPDLNCGDRKSDCDLPVSRLFSIIKDSRRRCSLANMFGRYQLIDFKLNPNEYV